MAKLTGPLFSLGASGSIAKTLTFGKWKGIPTARQRVDPANPNTAAQQTQRGFMASGVAFWRGYLTGTDGKAAWNTEATASGKPQSGFNSFTSSAVKVSAEDPDASFVTGIEATIAAALDFAMASLNDGAVGDEAGNFTITVGSTTTQMLDSYVASIAAGEVSFNLSADYVATDVIYCQILKTAGALVAAKRSGIFKVTLT